MLFYRLTILQFYKLYTQWISQPIWKKHIQTIAMAPGSYTIQQSFCVNLWANPIKQDELTGIPKKSDTGSNKAFILFKAFIPPLVPFSAKNFFIKFIKVFMEIMQAQAQALAEYQDCFFMIKTRKTYWGKFYMEYYYFCQQYKDYF